jgi:serine/threonine-protein kinase
MPAFAARRAGEHRLYVRRLDESEPRELKGTEGGYDPFFSADGEWIAYAVMSKGLFKVAVTGGVPQPVCEGREIYAGAWGGDRRIVFGHAGWQTPGGRALDRLGGGRVPYRLTTANTKAGSVRHIEPFLLPGGSAALFTILRKDQASIATVSLQTARATPLIDSGSHAHYLPTGHLAYESEGHLYCVPFDPARQPPVDVDPNHQR